MLEQDKASQPAERTVTPRQPLRAVAGAIAEAVREARQHAESSVHAAVRAGRLLIEAKAALPHGDWDQWLQSSVDLAPRTARAYMQLARRFAELTDSQRRQVVALPLRQAMGAITDDGKATPRPPRHLPQRVDMAVRHEFERAHRALRSVAGDVGLRAIKTDRIKRLRDKLQTVVEQLDRMAADVD